MKYYLNTKTLEKFGFELDGSQDNLITSDMIPLTNLDSNGHPFYSYNADGSVNQQDTPIPNATTITNKQGRLQLLALGKYADVQTAINSLPSPQKEQSQIEYDFSQTWSITDTTLLSLMGALGIADTDLQTLFNEASKL